MSVNTVTDKTLVSEVSQATGLGKPIVDAVIQNFFEKVREAVINGDKVVIGNTMVMTTKKTNGKRGRHPLTGEVMTFPPTIKLSIKGTRNFRDEIKKNGSL